MSGYLIREARMFIGTLEKRDIRAKVIRFRNIFDLLLMFCHSTIAK